MNLLAVFHPTPFCNLACRYCWAPNRDNTARMPLGTFSRAVTQIFRNPRLSRIDLCWLTGEPLVMGLDYYREAVALANSLRPSGPQVRFIVQTNGTLINDEWATFFAANDFTVGVSVDGPRALHDSQRQNKAGQSTFESTLRGIEHLIAHKVKGGALCVITKKTLESSPDELFQFFHSRNLSWSYLIEAKIGDNACSDNALGKEDLPALRSFLGRLIDLWGDHPDAYIRDFDQLSRRLFGTRMSEVDFNNQGCLDIVNVNADGTFFWGNPELMSASKGVLKHLGGSVHVDDVWTIRDTAEFQMFEEETHKGIQKCLDECPYFVGCRGGNPAHKFYQFGRFDVSSHLTCELNDQVIAELLLERLESSSSSRNLST